MSPEKRVKMARIMKSAKILLDIISIEELEVMEKEALREITEGYYTETPLDMRVETLT